MTFVKLTDFQTGSPILIDTDSIIGVSQCGPKTFVFCIEKIQFIVSDTVNEIETKLYTSSDIEIV